MSIMLMSEVFSRYPRGGSEMLLALALADHAHDDGTCVRPSVGRLAQKTRQSERAVQYQLRNMEAQGWLQLVGSAKGGRNTPREYRINPVWLGGGDLSPSVEKGAIQRKKGCNPAQERVQSSARKGAIQRKKGCNPASKRVQQLLHPNQEQPSIRATKSKSM